MHDCIEMEGADRTVMNLPLEVKADGTPGTFEGYGAVFGNTDRDGDVVERGAFAASLQDRMPALLWQHNAKEPIGRFDVVREDERGLYVKGRLSMTGRGAEAYDLLKLGALNGLSIGFVTKEALRNRATGTRTIKRAELMEVSLVTFPANELARVSTVKHFQTIKGDAMIHPVDDIETPRDFERLLRDAGFSRTRAKAITAKGFKQPQGESVSQLVTVVRNKTENLHGLSHKRLNIGSLVRSLDRGKSRAAVIRDILYSLSGVYKSIRGTSMPLYLLPGETAKFNLPLRFGNQSTSVVSVQTPESINEFKCDINYFEWTDKGPMRRRLELSHRERKKTMEVGGQNALDDWLNREIDQLEKEDRLDQFDRILARVNRVISDGLAPTGSITNIRTSAQSRVRISRDGTANAVEAMPFRITAR